MTLKVKEWFLNKTKRISINKNTDKSDYIKIGSSIKEKTIQNKKRHTTDWEKISPTNITDKRTSIQNVIHS